MSAAGVILAGGRSSRMGRPKSELLLRNGSSLLEHATRTLASVRNPSQLKPIFLAGLDKAHSGSLSDLHPLPDLHPGNGPVGGILSVLSHLQSARWEGKALVCIPVDMPRLDSLHLETLLLALNSKDPGPLVTCFHGSPLPLAVRWHAKLVSRVAELLDTLITDGLSVHQLCTQLSEGAVLELNREGDILQNINTPQDWEHFLGEEPT